MEQVTTNPTYKLVLSSSPHIHSERSTKQVMWMVAASLIPSAVASVIFFGLYQLLIILTAVAGAVGTEALIKKIRKREITVDDGSAVVTGLLLALVLPPNFSLFGTLLGSIISIAIAKELFGGLGYNIFNPALVGRAFLQAAFPVAMTTWTINSLAVDTVSSATPLASAKFDHLFASTQNLFLGNVNGSLGETSSLAILIGGLFLIAMNIANWRIPLSMMIGVILFGGIFWLIDPAKYPDPIFHLTAGGFLFGAFFMATDWVTSPLTSKGMWIFGFGISLIVVMIRLFGGLPEGVMYAILVMNGFVPLINRFTKPKIFGAANE